MIKNFSEYKKELFDKGYFEFYSKTDAEVIKGQTCEQCGNYLIYEGFTDDLSYKAFSVCHNCDTAEEF